MTISFCILRVGKVVQEVNLVSAIFGVRDCHRGIIAYQAVDAISLDVVASLSALLPPTQLAGKREEAFGIGGGLCLPGGKSLEGAFARENGRGKEEKLI